MKARYRDERVAGSWAQETSVLRIDTMSRHIRSAIGAPIPELVLADQIVDSPSGCGSRGQTLVLLRWVLGTLLVKEGHGMGQSFNWCKNPQPYIEWIKISNLME